MVGHIPERYVGCIDTDGLVTVLSLSLEMTSSLDPWPWVLGVQRCKAVMFHVAKELN